MRPARGSYPCGHEGCDFVARSPGQLGGHRTSHHGTVPRCTDHEPRVASYLAAHDDAERRMKRGERQKRCLECGLWSWPTEPQTQRPRLTTPQRALLDEIQEAGVLYVRRYGHYYRTVDALVKKGYAVLVEPDYSRIGQDGYAATAEAGDGES